ncbi:MAG: energy transducer TonB [Verrucomicrobia bacterium]|jgi:protein TonB|nr:energy transducer TonB [Verrucomicrobiota bacterium]
MRKVYQNETSGAGVAIAVFVGVGFTALLFGFIPFAHRVNKPDRTLELVKTSAIELPPPAEEAPPPPVEEEKPPQREAEPELAEAQQQLIPISADLEVATGTGGGFLGVSEIRSLTAASEIQDEVFDVAELEKRPEAVSQVAPMYPPELRKAKIEGLVTLVFVLDETGRVDEPRVENSSRPEFEKPALDAIRKWRFSPGMKDGQAVRTYIRLPLRFRVTAG